MALLHYLWSRVAASNASADANINWAEGQSPSSVNDSARAMMASAAAFRDDIAGAIATGGTSTAYTVTSYQVFDTLAHMGGMVIAFTPHATNGATVTLNVDGLGAKPLRSAPSTELLAGTLVQGTPYVATYNNSDAVWYLQNFFGNAYNIPLSGGLPFFGATAPNSAFVFPFGQAISRSTYSTLFSLLSTTYGVGDGSTTFNIPDLRGRVPAGKDNMGGSAASRITSSVFSPDGTTLGAVAGTETVALAASQIPSITSSGTASVSSTSTNVITYSGSLFAGNTGAGSQGIFNTIGLIGQSSIPSTGSASVTSSNTSLTASGAAHSNVQPSIVCNYIMRII